MTATHDTRPDVAAFVAEVRALLGDLTPDEREELLDGLEADLAEQLDDGAPDLLADPASYAAELRAAAGLPASRSRRWNRPDWSGAEVHRELDRLRTHWSALTERHPVARQAWAIAVVLRPAWWVLRAWVAVTLVDQISGTYEPVSVVPSLLVPGLGLVVLAGAVVGSVLVGQGRLWPGWRGQPRALARLTLVVLNVVAVLGLVSLAQHSADERYRYGFGESVATAPVPGVLVDGRVVRNIYPYDAEGQPLSGVQLFDGAGRPIALSPEQASAGEWAAPDRLVGCPWINGTRRLYNVFPLPERVQRLGACRAALDTRLGPGVLPTPPLSQVPPVTLPSAAVPSAAAPSPTAAP